MPIAFDCPGCRKPYTVEDALAGQKARCKHCGREFRIPGAPPIPVVLIDTAGVSSPPTPPPVPKAAVAPPSPAPARSPALSGPNPAPTPAPIVPAQPAGPLPRMRPWAKDEPEPLPADSPLLAIDTATPAKKPVPDALIDEGPRPRGPSRGLVFAAAGALGLLILIGAWLFSATSLGPSPENDPEAAQGEPAPNAAPAGEPPAPAPAPVVAATSRPVAGPRLVLSAGTARRDEGSLTFQATCRANPGEPVGEGVVWVIQTPSTTARIPVLAPKPGSEATLERPAPEAIRPGDPGPFLSYLALPGEGDLLVPVSNSLPLRAVAATEPAAPAEPAAKPKAAAKKAADPFAPPRPPF